MELCRDQLSASGLGQCLDFPIYFVTRYNSDAFYADTDTLDDVMHVKE